MAETKTVAERLREAESLCETHGMCRVVLHAINGEATCPPIASCVDCKIGILRTLARQIEAEKAEPRLPEGIEWPRFDNDELVKFGDEFVDFEGETHFVGKINFDEMGNFFIECGDWSGTWGKGEPVKRPEPEVLDADNVPIHVGDTVYAHNAEPLTVRELTSKALTLIEDSNGILWEIRSDKLTHRKPDTFKSVVEEMLTDFDSHDTIELDGYFDRLRKLLGGE